MKKRDLLKYIVLVCAVYVLDALSPRIGALDKEASSSAHRAVLGTAFTYQGRLQDNGALVTGAYDFRFTLYDVATGGLPLSGTTPLTLTAVSVSRGLFTVQLDFGNIFGNQQLYLDIAMRPGGSGGAFITLTPRQAITPVPHARYAVQASSVPWDGVSNKPAGLSWRRQYVPAAAMNYTPGSNITLTEKGLRWPNTTQLGGFGIPQPADWDKTTPFTVTLYFALHVTSTSGKVQWRLNAGGSDLNLSPTYPDSGWDQIYYGATEDAAVLAYGNAGGHSFLMKSQSWVSRWSSTYGTWHFGTNVTTGNDFSDNPMWFFYFRRGISIPNGETYAGDMYVVGAEIKYQAAQ